MKRVIYSVAIALVCGGWIFGKYSSMVEAEIACREWKEKGVVLLRGEQKLSGGPFKKHDCSKSPPDKALDCFRANEYSKYAQELIVFEISQNRVPTRRCNHERETRQFLGLVGSFDTSQSRKYIGDQVGTWKIKKRFRY